jgi:ParB family chromosome partitioning protein
MSADKRRGLGLGLGSLIPTADAQKSTVSGDTTTAGAVYAELPILDISPNPKQPRTVFEEEALAELVYSIKEIGLLQPIVVRRRDGGKFEIVAGERRWRASQQAGLTHIPAIIRETADEVLLRDALLENLHRANLNALEEAAAYQQLLDDFGCTQEELSTRIGRSRPQVSNTLRLLKLPPTVQRRVAAGVLSAGHARALLGLSTPAAMDALATRIVAEGLSVRTTEELVSLGGQEQPAKPIKPRKGRMSAPGLQGLADRLMDRLDTRVKVEMGRQKGTVCIEFATTGDLKRIVDMIDRD